MINEIQRWLADNEEDHEKKSFWASDSEKMLFDIFHTWMGTEPTNPIEPETRMIFNAGKMMELAIVEVMEKAEMLANKFIVDVGDNGKIGEAKAGDIVDVKPEQILRVPTKEEQLRIEMERRGVPISGYVDAVLSDGTPVEIKSFYGAYQSRDLEAGKPRTSYLKQLAIYMDYLGVNLGKLLYIDRGTGQMFEFDLTRQDDLTFQCNDIQFNLDNTYKRWELFYRDHILTKVEPPIEYRYKIPPKEVNWKSLSRSDISKARNNRRVIGDHPWAVLYSPYKDLIVERQGTTLGYSSGELEEIKRLTAGFTNWK